MFRAHLLIVRRAKLYYTVSGIITLKQVSGLKLLKYFKIIKMQFYKYEHIVVLILIDCILIILIILVILDHALVSV